MLIVRFFINKAACDYDFRPIRWPIKYPYWCTGEDNANFILVAYLDSLAELKELWPDAGIDFTEEVEKIKFSSRLPKPAWYNP